MTTIETAGTKNDESPQHRVDERRAYRAPRLTRHGDIRDITLGGTIGAADSGAGDTIERPSGT